MDSIWQFEIDITLFLQSLGSWLKAPFIALSFLADEKFFIIMMPLIYWCVNSLMGLRLAFMLVSSNALNSCLKILFHTPRPFWFNSEVKSLSNETAFGMPSGHSQNSASLWGMMAVTAKKKWLTIIVFIMIFLIGLSRVYLGMHFVHDVISGWLVAGILLWVYLRLEKPIAKWLAPKNLSIQILYIFLLSVLLVLLSLGSKAASSSWQLPEVWIENAAITNGAIPDPFNIDGVFTVAGVAFGFLSGYAWWVKKFGMPKVEGSWVKRLLRYIVGLIGVIIFYVGLKVIFPEDPAILGLILRFVRYALIGVWVSAIAPALFVKLKLNK